MIDDCHETPRGAFEDVGNRDSYRNNTTPLAYGAAVATAAECETRCANDAACVAYSFATTGVDVVNSSGTNCATYPTVGEFVVSNRAAREGFERIHGNKVLDSA